MLIKKKVWKVKKTKQKQFPYTVSPLLSKIKIPTRLGKFKKIWIFKFNLFDFIIFKSISPVNLKYNKVQIFW